MLNWTGLKLPKGIFNRVLSLFIAFCVLTGSFLPIFNVVETRAILISADILSKQPLLKHYFDIAKLSQYIVNSFYIGQGIAKGEIPKKSSGPTPKHNTTSTDMAITLSYMLQFKICHEIIDISATNASWQMSFIDDGTLQTTVFDSSIYGQNAARMKFFLSIIIMSFFTRLFMLARSDVNNATIKMYTNTNGPV